MMATLALMMMMVVTMMMMMTMIANQDSEDDCHVMIVGLITFKCTYCGKYSVVAATPILQSVSHAC